MWCIVPIEEEADTQNSRLSKGKWEKEREKAKAWEKNTSSAIQVSCNDLTLHLCWLTFSGGSRGGFRRNPLWVQLFHFHVALWGKWVTWSNRRPRQFRTPDLKILDLLLLLMGFNADFNFLNSPELFNVLLLLLLLFTDHQYGTSWTPAILSITSIWSRFKERHGAGTAWPPRQRNSCANHYYVELLVTNLIGTKPNEKWKQRKSKLSYTFCTCLMKTFSYLHFPWGGVVFKWGHWRGHFV